MGLLGFFLVLLPAAFQHTESLSRAALAPIIRPLLKPSPPTSQRLVIRAPDSTSEGDALKPFDQIVKSTERLDGLFTLYRDRGMGKLYLELQPEQMNVNYLCTVTLESGLGARGLYSGLPITDFLFNFRRVDNKIQFVVPNVYFRARPGDPIQRSIQRSFSDSVLQALPIRAYNPKRKSVLLDLGPLLLGDFPGLTPILSMLLDAPYSLDANQSYFGLVKAFPLNVELESIYGFSSTAEDKLPAYISTVPDSRNFNLRVHYSFSQLPVNRTYRPRLADDRVGYFITAFQDLSDDTPRDPYVRYINRWHLEKKNPDLPLSPPKQPIVFWIENTVPLEYRDTVREGILMWNRAFEAAGFQTAIEVRQMPDNATWDPADVRYNTIRWLSSFDSGFLGIGPSRINPFTGEILDADILIDASVARYFKQEYRALGLETQMRFMPSLARLTGNRNLCSYGLEARTLEQPHSAAKPLTHPRITSRLLQNYDLCYGLEASRQFAIGSLSLTMVQNVSPRGTEMKHYVQDFLRLLIAHEVGHTLGLRHNFRGSAMLSPADLNKPEITRQNGLVSSVMDYSAVNLAPQGTPQGDYFTHVVGPYDRWAIAYGYSPSHATTPESDRRFLEDIARRAPEPNLAYATDEDAFAGLDPQVHPFDLSSDLLTYVPWQLENARQLWQRLDRQYPSAGESFNDVRVLFDEIFSYYFQYSSFLTTYVGGQSFNRYRGGDAQGRLPFEPVSLDKQRQALALLNTYVFDANAFRFSGSFLNKLAPSRWNHWGNEPEAVSLDYPIHDRILLLQSIILSDLLDYNRLARLRDAELRSPTAEIFSMPELFDTLQTAIWREVLKPEGRLALSSLRRGLQRQHLNILTNIVLRRSQVPEDARTLAWYKLKQLRSSLDHILRHAPEMDVSTQAHLEETRDRVIKALDAQLQAE